MGTRTAPIAANALAPAKRLRWLLLSLLLLGLDQAAKYAASVHLAYGEYLPVTRFFNWTHQHNTGAAFSFLANAGGWQNAFLIVLALVVSTALGCWLWRENASRTYQIALCAIIGGALGNVTDRLLRGYVVDFLDFHYGQWHWPAFNLADVWIIVGAAALIWAQGRRAG
ncbi:signal peptidase II [Salinisphaera aquimarina]|uniref:Lipoprotein signal peptidase n=1 Tax=Salinisphaera aquimarina TaxID=2094031 RepID=A0ABV7EVS9_9GAMM